MDLEAIQTLVHGTFPASIRQQASDRSVARRSNNTRIYLGRTATTGSRIDNAYEKTASWAERRQPTSGPIRRVYFVRLAESSAGVSADGSVQRRKMKASARPICGLQNASIHRQRAVYGRQSSHDLRPDIALILSFKSLLYMYNSHSTNVGGAPKRKPNPYQIFGTGHWLIPRSTARIRRR